MLNKIRKQSLLGKQLLEDKFFLSAKKLTDIEDKKEIFRFDVINYLLKRFDENKSKYLEIGVRNPSDNFNKINCKNKYSVDPGLEYEINPVDFKLSSDDFFSQLRQNKILDATIKFDVVFIDGLHLADQVYRDIINSLEFLSEEGFIVVHDCNPPTEYHARENHSFNLSPALNNWNGSVWKAFYKCILSAELSCCCIDSDWGIGVISKKKYFNHLNENFNPFFEFTIFEQNREKSLNLITFEIFKNTLDKK